jgi:hypothetical protein
VFSEPHLAEQGTRAAYDVGLIEQDAAQGWIRCQYPCQEFALATTDVRERSGPREVIASYEGIDHPRRKGRHRRVEDGSLLGVCRPVFSEDHPVQLAEGGPAGPDAVEQMPPTTPERLLADQHQLGLSGGAGRAAPGAWSLR